jgi:hypothetical protein
MKPFSNRLVGARSHARAVVALVAATFAIAGCGDGTAAAVSGPEPSGVVRGESKPMGAGSAFSWVTTDVRGNATAVGVSFDDAALTKLGTVPTEIVLALPAGRDLRVRTAVINWNPQGHPPAHVYDVPHFDFHFYTLGEAARMAIVPIGPAAASTPAPNLVPLGFRTDGATVPMMGMHFISTSQPEFHGGTFTATPIYGYWNGHLAFVESMVTLDYLRRHPALSAALPQPARFEQSGLYPTQWSVSYDGAAHRYTIAFSDLVSR